MAMITVTAHAAHKNKIIPSVDYVKYNSVQLANKPSIKIGIHATPSAKRRGDTGKRATF